MDKEYVKTIIFSEDGKDERLIKRGDTIDLELFEMLCSAKSSKVVSAFYRNDDSKSKNDAFYYMQVKCPSCGCVVTRKVCKSNIIDTIKKIKHERGGNKRKVTYLSSISLLCPECSEREKKIKESEDKKTSEEFARNNAKKSKDYIFFLFKSR